MKFNEQYTVENYVIKFIKDKLENYHFADARKMVK